MRWVFIIVATLFCNVLFGQNASQAVKSSVQNKASFKAVYGQHQGHFDKTWLLSYMDTARVMLSTHFAGNDNALISLTPSFPNWGNGKLCVETVRGSNSTVIERTNDNAKGWILYLNDDGTISFQSYTSGLLLSVVNDGTGARTVLSDTYTNMNAKFLVYLTGGCDVVEVQLYHPATKTFLYCTGANGHVVATGMMSPVQLVATTNINDCFDNQTNWDIEGLTTPVRFIDLSDYDGDGHKCIACGGDDCDDRDSNRFPGNPEVGDSLGHDEDCDPFTFGTNDGDGDGFISSKYYNIEANGVVHRGNDCRDDDPNIVPTTLMYKDETHAYYCGSRVEIIAPNGYKFVMLSNGTADLVNKL